MPESEPKAPSAGPFAVLGDQPAAPGEDRLGFERFAASLARRLLTSVEHTPFTVGVLGDWGQGKTTVMRMLQARLGAEGCPTIWFEPWKYNDREGVWKGLALTLVREIKARDSLVREIRRKQGALKTFLGGFLWSRLIGDKWGENLVKAATSEPWSAASLHEMEKTLDDLFRLANPAEQGRPVVLFVDDLDRCLPEAARSVLEAVKLVLARKGLITVMGIAEGELARAVHSAYAESMKGSADELDPDWGRKYIRKIIQMPFPVPQISEGSFEGYVGHCLEASGIGSVLGDRPEWRSVVREACGGNLREVKRFLNHFISEMDKAAANLETLKDEGRSGAIEVTASPARVAFVLLLAWRFRNFYRHVRAGGRRDLLLRYQLAFTSDLPDEEATEKLLGSDAEFHHDPALAEFFHLCLRGADGRSPLVREFRDGKDLLPYLQFGLLPVEKGPEGMKSHPEGQDQEEEVAAESSGADMPPHTQNVEEGPVEEPAGGDRSSREENDVEVGDQTAADAEEGSVVDSEVEEPPEEPVRSSTQVFVSPGPDALSSYEEGQSLLASGRFEEAEHKLRRAVRRAEKAEDSAGVALLLRLVAEALQGQERMSDAVSVLAESAATLERSGDRQSYSESLLLLAEAHRLAGMNSDSIGIGRQGVEIARELGDHLSLTRALEEVAKGYEAMQQPALAQEYREEILDIAEELAQPTLKGEALFGLGVNLLAQGKLEAAEGDLRQAMEVARELGQWDLEASALSALVEIDERKGDVEEALQKQRLVVDLRQHPRDGEGDAVVLTRLADLLAKTGRLEEAVEIVREVRTRPGPAVAIQDAELLETLGRHLLDLDEHDEAREFMMEALQRYQEQGAAEKELEIGKLLMF